MRFSPLRGGHATSDASPISPLVVDFTRDFSGFPGEFCSLPAHRQPAFDFLFVGPSLSRSRSSGCEIPFTSFSPLPSTRLS